MKIVIITPEEDIKNEIDTVNDLFRSGLERLHLRKNDYYTSDYRRYIRNIDPEFHNRVVVTAGYELYNEFELGGIHLNSAARRDESVRKKISHIPASAVSTSFHTWQKIIDNDFRYGYVFISPVFDSISKKEYKANINPYGATETKQKLAAKHRYCPKLIGLGGVGVLEIEALHNYGFDGGAMLGSLWMSGNPVATLERALNLANSFDHQNA